MSVDSTGACPLCLDIRAGDFAAYGPELRGLLGAPGTGDKPAVLRPTQPAILPTSKQLRVGVCSSELQGRSTGRLP